FCTAVCMLIDPERGFARVAAAGHVPPIVVTAEGSARFQDLVPSVAIGALEEVEYSDTALMLHPGDTLLLYTDGLVERRRTSLDEGLDRLLQASSEAGGDPAILVDHVVRTMTQAGDAEDDVAAIALTIQPEPSEPITLRLPTMPVFISALRRRLRERLRAIGMPDDDVFDIVLAVSEAAANAMEHASDPISPSISVTVAPANGRIVLSVRDYGRWKEAAPEGERGRGLKLIEALLEAPSIERSPEGTTVTFRANIPGGDL
ncbi:MAG: SpoIIE family protein phosphatase, partial [Actinomycetota bacterium]